MRTEFILNPLRNDQIMQLCRDMEIGIQSEKVIIVYRDYLFTTMHPEIQSDSNNEERDDRNIITPCVGDHVCSKCHSTKSNNYRKLGNDQIYFDLLNWCNRHRHTPNYCLRCGKCRFNFPRPISNQTEIIIKEISYKHHKEKVGSLRYTAIEILNQSNEKNNF